MQEQKLASRLQEIRDAIDQLCQEIQKDEIPLQQQTIGLFDGEFMTTEDGKKYQVPPNYASKSMLVPGDTLRLIKEGPQNLFKHVDKAERLEVAGVLIKRGEDWIAICDEGEFKILPASIKHFQADVGDKIKMFLPKEFAVLETKWGAMSELVKDEVEGARMAVETEIPVETQAAASEQPVAGSAEPGLVAEPKEDIDLI
ncbi:hypothetical protein KJ596_00450 [Patescibacteria group bacterium]|nr:hypothetical protein [Patescibacteria group bacterium]MBU1868532.1 hypothetical protein [Patescibacteria group bacterium]